MAESYERIHRSNLVGMGILPLQFASRSERRIPSSLPEKRSSALASPVSLKAMLDGKFANAKTITVIAEDDLGKTKGEFSATVRIDTPQEILYYQNGGILQYVLVNWRQKKRIERRIRRNPNGKGTTERSCPLVLEQTAAFTSHWEKKQ